MVMLHDNRNTPEALRVLGISDAAPEPGWEALVRTATRMFDASAAFVSILDERADFQYFKGKVGLREPWASANGKILSKGLCAKVLELGTAFAVNSIHGDAVTDLHSPERELKFDAYVGVPIFAADRKIIGTFCVLDTRAREWTEDDVSVLEGLACTISEDLKRRVSFLESRAAHLALTESYRHLSRYNALRESISMAFMAPDIPPNDRIRALLRATAEALGMDRAAVLKIDGDRPEMLFQYPTGASLPPAAALTGSLASTVLSGQGQIDLWNVAESEYASAHDAFGRIPGSYIGAPLVIDGLVYGIIEFSVRPSKRAPWAEEELSLVSITTMFLCAFIGIFGNISALRTSENELIRALSMATKI